MGAEPRFLHNPWGHVKPVGPRTTRMPSPRLCRRGTFSVPLSHTPYLPPHPALQAPGRSVPPRGGGQPEASSAQPLPRLPQPGRSQPFTSPEAALSVAPFGRWASSGGGGVAHQMFLMVVGSLRPRRAPLIEPCSGMAMPMAAQPCCRPASFRNTAPGGRSGDLLEPLATPPSARGRGPSGRRRRQTGSASRTLPHRLACEVTSPCSPLRYNDRPGMITAEHPVRCEANAHDARSLGNDPQATPTAFGR
jgi:hypothetical protein